MTSSPMTAPAEIVHLVELFKSNYDQYRSPAFTEAAVRLHRQIDALVYELYGLTDEEIKVVEGAG